MKIIKRKEILELIPEYTILVHIDIDDNIMMKDINLNTYDDFCDTVMKLQQLMLVDSEFYNKIVGKHNIKDVIIPTNDADGSHHEIIMLDYFKNGEMVLVEFSKEDRADMVKFSHEVDLDLEVLHPGMW